MPQTTLETKSEVAVALLVTFTWGETHIERYCTLDRSLTIGGDVFNACPSLKIEFDELHGGTDATKVKLSIRREFSPFNLLLRGYAMPTVSAKIEECDAEAPESNRREIYFGRLEPIVSSTRSIATVEISGVKARLKAKMGFPALTSCPWIFGDQHTCRFNLETVTHEGVLVGEDPDATPNEITIDFGDDIPNLDNVRWREGYMEFDGLRIRIVTSYGDGRFEMSRVPPPEWAGERIKCVEGCNGEYTTCDTIRNNKDRFGGIGWGIPDRNPVYEESDA